DGLATAIATGPPGSQDGLVLSKSLNHGLETLSSQNGDHVRVDIVSNERSGILRWIARTAEQDADWGFLPRSRHRRRGPKGQSGDLEALLDTLRPDRPAVDGDAFSSNGDQRAVHRRWAGCIDGSIER